jgi:hypothetical protein
MPPVIRRSCALVALLLALTSSAPAFADGRPTTAPATAPQWTAAYWTVGYSAAAQHAAAQHATAQHAPAAQPATPQPGAAPSTTPQPTAVKSTAPQSTGTEATVTQSAVALSTTATRWTAYGFDIDAPVSMWPMFELLHREHFDWELATASQADIPIVWAELPTGQFGQYDRANRIVRLATVLQTSSVEARSAFLAHELTHANDDLNGRLIDMSSASCYDAEVRAFENEANLWIMLFGPRGKANPDPYEARENTKMRAFVGNAHFADLVVKTTASYIHECGRT